jgi:hypothetical protein
MGQVNTCIEDNASSSDDNNNTHLSATIIIDGKSDHNKHHSSIPEYPPLIILKDAFTQTTVNNIPASKSRSLRKTNSFAKWFRIILGLYLLVICMLISSTSLQSMLVYLHFIRYPFGDLTNLAKFDMHSARNINYTTTDNVLIRGWHMLPPGTSAIQAIGLSSEVERNNLFDSELSCTKSIVLYFHGNGANRVFNRRVLVAKQLASYVNTHVINIDYRGFGDSEGWPTEDGTALDALGLWKWLEGTVLNHPNQVNGLCEIPKVFIYGHRCVVYI